MGSAPHLKYNNSQVVGTGLQQDHSETLTMNIHSYLILLCKSKPKTGILLWKQVLQGSSPVDSVTNVIH